MARLIESPQDHLSLHIGALTAQNIALQCALEEREKQLSDAHDLIEKLQAKIQAAEPGEQAPEEGEGDQAA